MTELLLTGTLSLKHFIKIVNNDGTRKFRRWWWGGGGVQAHPQLFYGGGVPLQRSSQLLIPTKKFKEGPSFSSVCVWGGGPMFIPMKTYMSQCMRFPTMWHFDMCRLRRASAASL